MRMATLEATVRPRSVPRPTAQTWSALRPVVGAPAGERTSLRTDIQADRVRQPRDRRRVRRTPDTPLEVRQTTHTEASLVSQRLLGQPGGQTVPTQHCPER